MGRHFRTTSSSPDFETVTILWRSIRQVLTNGPASFPLEEVRAWSVSRLWELTIDHGHTVMPQTRSFVQQWIDHTRKSPKYLLSNSEALNLIKRREMKLKGTRSRFRNQRALEQWGGYSGVGRLVYRWPNVKVLLKRFLPGHESRVGMLNPNSRSLYTSALTPPPGMISTKLSRPPFQWTLRSC